MSQRVLVTGVIHDRDPVTLSPCHLVTLSSCHAVTLSPGHPLTLPPSRLPCYDPRTAGAAERPGLSRRMSMNVARMLGLGPLSLALLVVVAGCQRPATLH